MQICRILLISFVALSQIANATINGIDTFGSSQVTREQILAVAKDEIEQFGEALLSGNMDLADKNQVAAKLKIEKLATFAFIKLSLIQYPPPTPSTYITVDLVDPADRADRMNFLPAPTRSFEDPGRLLAEWDKYQSAGVELLLAGKLTTVDKCPAYHCIFGFKHPQLKKYGELFTREIPKYENQLFEILHEDKNTQHRATAAFLLAHTHNAKKLVNELTKNIRDNSEDVRNNVMRVLGFISQFYPEVDLPTEAIAESLKFPTTTDRNKTLFALFSLSKKKDKRRYLIKTCGPLLIAILKLQQPNNHDIAYQVLKNLSDKNFADRDYNSWEQWQKTTRGRPL
jgi:hypothetical protein